MADRIDWPTVLTIAKRYALAETGALGLRPTLRRVHYLLFSDADARAARYVNTQSAYKGLSRETAKARRAGFFPALTDLTRTLHEPFTFCSEDDVREWIAEVFMLDRRPLFEQSVLVAVEKAGRVPLLRQHFAWLDVTALRGYGSQTLLDGVGQDVIVSAGDYDPTGLDIERDLPNRTGCEVRRVALTAAQLAAHGLPPLPAKATDSRSARMAAEHGIAMQLELDALNPSVLLDLVADVTGLAIVDQKPVLPEGFITEAAAIRLRLGGAS